MAKNLASIFEPLLMLYGLPMRVVHCFAQGAPELQKRADRADQSVLFFLAGANFWEKHAKNCAIMSILDCFWSILDLLFGANFLGGKIGRC